MAKSENIEQQPGPSQLQQIIGKLTDGVIFVEADGRISWANDAALAMHEVPTLAALGTTTAEYHQNFQLNYRGGRAVPGDAYPLARLCRGEAFDNLIVDVRSSARPESDWVHRNRGLILHHQPGEPDCRVLIITDATDAFEAEERFESLFNANPAPALIARLDDYRFVRVNEGFLELSGWSRDAIVGHTIYDFDILEGAATKDKAKTLLKKGHTIPQMEAELPIPGGGTKLVLLAGHPAEMKNEPCMIFTFADLEPRRRAETALRQNAIFPCP